MIFNKIIKSITLALILGSSLCQAMQPSQDPRDRPRRIMQLADLAARDQDFAAGIPHPSDDYEQRMNDLRNRLNTLRASPLQQAAPAPQAVMEQINARQITDPRAFKSHDGKHLWILDKKQVNQSITLLEMISDTSEGDMLLTRDINPNLFSLFHPFLWHVAAINNEQNNEIRQQLLKTLKRELSNFSDATLHAFTRYAKYLEVSWLSLALNDVISERLQASLARQENVNAPHLSFWQNRLHSFKPYIKYGVLGAATLATAYGIKRLFKNQE